MRAGNRRPNASPSPKCWPIFLIPRGMLHFVRRPRNEDYSVILKILAIPKLKLLLQLTVG